MSAPLLEVHDLCKRFGGLVVTDHVSLQLHAGRIHALIGPNGAGKTTLVAQLAGQLDSDSGQVRLQGEDITRLTAHQRARRGLVRSFQITRLFRSLSVQDNLAVAVQAAGAGNFRPWRARPAAMPGVPELLQRLNLSAKAGHAVDQLSHGERRALEVGMALAARPRLVLLDEPMAGMGAEESEGMAALIESLRADCAVLLIEHDVQAVFRLADEVSVLVNGRIVASGAPEAVRRAPEVVAAYLGETEDDL
ncbi:MAG: ABC transporter ATP-binding protein [Rubrivivax sp.]|nr:ABC transporter ATP-binding protein [Rubrivivax sp.]